MRFVAIEDFRRCDCGQGQRCICSLKKDQPSDSNNKPKSTASFRHHHRKQNDKAHKCGLPYTILPPHTIHIPSDAVAAVRSVVERGSPESATTTLDDKTLEFASVPTASPCEMEPVDQNFLMHEATTPLNNEQRRILSLQVSSFPPTSNPSSAGYLPFHNDSEEHLFAGSDLAISSAAFNNAPPVDWSSFPFFFSSPNNNNNNNNSSSSMPAAASTQSYASFDFSTTTGGFPAPSSSTGDMSEMDEVGPLPFDSSGLCPPPQQIMPPNGGSDTDRESFGIDDLLKSRAAAAAAMEQQQRWLQCDQMVDSKKQQQQLLMRPEYGGGGDDSSSSFEPLTTPLLTTGSSATDPVWAAALFTTTPGGKDSFFSPQVWA